MYQINKYKEYVIPSIGKISWGIIIPMIIPHILVYLFQIWTGANNFRLSDFGTWDNLERAAAVNISTQIVINYISFFLITLYFIRRNTYGLLIRNDFWRFDFSKYWYIGAIVIGFAFGFAYYFGLFALTGKPYGAWRLGEKPFQSHILIVFISLFTILPPITEELFFRGICYNIFRRYLGIIPSITISSFLFTIWHPQSYYDSCIVAIPILLFGIIQCLLLEKLRSVIPLVIIHAVSNLVIGIFTNILRPMGELGI